MMSAVTGRTAVPASVTASNGEAVRRLVLGGLGIARFSDFMIDQDIAEGRLVELFPGRIDAAPLSVTALYLVRASGLRRLAGLNHAGAVRAAARLAQVAAALPRPPRR